MVKRFAEDRDIALFVDLHGHRCVHLISVGWAVETDGLSDASSRKKNIFIYGCESKDMSRPRLLERVFPRMLWKNAHTFSFADSSFRVQKSKESTARVRRLLIVAADYLLIGGLGGRLEGNPNA